MEQYGCFGSNPIKIWWFWLKFDEDLVDFALPTPSSISTKSNCCPPETDPTQPMVVRSWWWLSPFATKCKQVISKLSPKPTSEQPFSRVSYELHTSALYY